MVVMWEGNDKQVERLLGDHHHGRKASSLKRDILKTRQQRVFTTDGFLDGGWGRIATRMFMLLIVFLSIATITNGLARGDRPVWQTPALFGVAILMAYYLSVKGALRPFGWLVTSPVVVATVGVMTTAYIMNNT